MLRDVTLPSGEQRQIDFKGKIYARYAPTDYPLPKCMQDWPVVRDGSELFWSAREAADEMGGIQFAASEIVNACRRIRGRTTGRIAGHTYQWLDEWLYEQLGMEVED